MTVFPAVKAAVSKSSLWIFLLLSCSCCCWAVLGGNEQSVLADQEHLKGSHRAITSASYSVHEITTASGHVVREFVSPSGTVFAVGWEGPTMVDLSTLLGTYFELYKQSMAQRPPSLNAPIDLETPGFVFQQAGHMRAFHGRAYVPALAPSGAQLGDIR
jgi:hypothetical protein